MKPKDETKSRKMDVPDTQSTLDQAEATSHCSDTSRKLFLFRSPLNAT